MVPGTTPRRSASSLLVSACWAHSRIIRSRNGWAAALAPPPGDGLGVNFWRLWSATAVADLADGVLKVALPLVAATLTDSPALVAGVGVALTLPWLLIALPAGVLVDRVDRRAAMVICDGVRIAVLMALVAAVAAVFGSIAVLCGAAFLLGTAETVHDTAGQAMLPQVVDRELLIRANSRQQAVALTANQFAGPPLGGLLVAIGAAVAFAAPALLWAVALGAYCCCAAASRSLAPRTPPSAPTSPKDCASSSDIACCARWR